MLKFSSFNKLLNIAIMISYLARSSIKEFYISSLHTLDSDKHS
jgi:hypothetical protein